MVWTDLAVSLIRHDDGRPRFTVAMIEDITERYELQQRLRFQALHDPLTGLPNRTLFFETAGAGPRRAPAPTQRVGVCFLDLDGFKAINDTPRPRRRRPAAGRGRPRGWPRRGRPGHLVARMGGDEFVILVDGLRRHRRRGRGRRGRAGRRRRARSASAPTSWPSRPASGIVERPVADDHRRRADEGRRHHALLGQGGAAGAGGRCTTRSAAPASMARSALVAALPARAGRGASSSCDYQPIVSLRRRHRARRWRRWSAGGTRTLGPARARTGSSGWPRRPG